jgi:hypothetical protein
MYLLLRMILGKCGSNRVVRASGCQCQSRNSPWFDPSILRHSESEGRAADEAVLNNVQKKKKIQENSPFLKSFVVKFSFPSIIGLK